MESIAETHIQIDGVYKVFGRDPAGAVEALRGGATRAELQEQGSTPAVIDASFNVAEGEIFVVMGLSGSGKSTLVRTINRLYEPTAGTITIGGVDVTALSERELRELRARKISMVFQHFALFPHRTVVQNAGWGLEVLNVSDDERQRRANEALEMVGLSGWGDHYPSQLSGGMQQRVGLARALATDSDVMLMDEAFSALDPLIRREMQDQLIDLQENLRKTIVFITHDLNEAMRLGDRIAVLRDGRIVQIGTAEQILTDPATDYVASFVQDVDRARVLTADTVMEDTIARVDRHEGPRAALRIMREHQLSALFVVGAGRQLHGVVLDDAMAEAVRRDDDSFEDLIQRDVASVAPDTLLNDVLVPSAESAYPVPVVDDGQLVGVVPRATLLMALGGGGDEDAGSSDSATVGSGSADSGPPDSDTGVATDA